MKFIPVQASDGSFHLALIEHVALTEIEKQILDSLVGGTLEHTIDSTSLNHYWIRPPKSE